MISKFTECHLVHLSRKFGTTLYEKTLQNYLRHISYHRKELRPTSLAPPQGAAECVPAGSMHQLRSWTKLVTAKSHNYQRNILKVATPCV